MCFKINLRDKLKGKRKNINWSCCSVQRKAGKGPHDFDIVANGKAMIRKQWHDPLAHSSLPTPSLFVSMQMTRPDFSISKFLQDQKYAANIIRLKFHLSKHLVEFHLPMEIDKSDVEWYNSVIFSWFKSIK